MDLPIYLRDDILTKVGRANIADPLKCHMRRCVLIVIGSCRRRAAAFLGADFPRKALASIVGRLGGQVRSKMSLSTGRELRRSCVTGPGDSARVPQAMDGRTRRDRLSSTCRTRPSDGNGASGTGAGGRLPFAVDQLL